MTYLSDDRKPPAVKKHSTPRRALPDRHNPPQSDSDSDQPPSSPSPPHNTISQRAINSAATRFGVMNLLPVDVRKRHRHLYSFDQLNAVTNYVIYIASTRLIKLIDFALLSAHDTWALLNMIIDHALDIYQDCHRYPVQDSLTAILLHDTEKAEKLIGGESERGLAIDRYALLWQNGENAKLGDVITFVQTYRRLMRTILSTCCCYFMNRRASNTRSFIEKHPCLLPKATQGIYFSLFLRMRAGHELLCLSHVNEAQDAYLWLDKFDRLRETMWRKRQIPYTNRLRDHLTLVKKEMPHQDPISLPQSSTRYRRHPIHNDVKKNPHFSEKNAADQDDCDDEEDY